MYNTLDAFIASNTPEQIANYDFKNEAPWQEVRNEQDPIKKFKRYKQNNTNKADGKFFDCDNSNGRCPLTDSIYSSLWGWSYQRRFKLPSHLQELFGVYWDRLGSDTMNSFLTTYTRAVKILGADSAAINPALRKFASLTHSIGNFTLVPFHLLPNDANSFNQYRGANLGKYFVFDYFDLSLKLIKENVSNDVFVSYIDTFYLNDYVDQNYNVLPLFKRHADYLSHTPLDLDNPEKFLPRTEKELNEYLQNVIEKILARGYRIAAHLTGQERFRIGNEDQPTQLSDQDFWQGVRTIKGFVTATKNEIAFAVRSIQRSPLDSFSVLFPFGTFLAGLICAIASVVQFASNGGYHKQLEIIQEFGVSSVDQLFTYETANNMYSGLSGLILLSILVVSSILVYIQFFKKSHWIKRLVAVILAVCSTAVIAVHEAFNAIIDYRIKLTDKQTEQFVSYFGQFTEEQINNQTSLLIGIAITATLLLYIVLATTKKCRPSLRFIVVASLSNYVVLPVFIFFAENLIPLGILTLFMVVGLLITRFITNNISTEDNQPIVNSQASHSKSTTTEARKNEYHVPRGIKLQKVKGATCDYIKRYNSIGGNSIVCTVYQLESNKFKIYDEYGNRLMAKDIPWK